MNKKTEITSFAIVAVFFLALWTLIKTVSVWLVTLLFSVVFKLRKVVAVALISLFVSLGAPSIYRNYINSISDTSIVLISGTYKNKPIVGTGFHVTAPNGKKYLLTNRHICEFATAYNGQHLSASHESEEKAVKIVSISKTDDLCALTPLENSKPLKLSESVSVGDSVSIKGHPQGLNSVVHVGYVVASVVDFIPTELNENNKGTCIYKNTRYMPAFTIGASSVCVMRQESISTTVMAIPGMSGSPVFSMYGGVVGILYSTSGWLSGNFIKTELINSFLSELE
jgi:S1-C subfamily serine protease